MPRRPKFTDNEISNAIQSMIAAGEAVNVRRVRNRLGGGNASRIKQVLAKSKRKRRTRHAPGQAENPFIAEVEKVLDDVAVRLRAIATKFGLSIAGTAENGLVASTPVIEAAGTIENLRRDLGQTKTSLQKAETDRDEAIRQRENVRAGLRNAETELQAAKRALENSARSQEKDREEIRQLHLQIERLQSTRSQAAVAMSHSPKAKQREGKQRRQSRR